MGGLSTLLRRYQKLPILFFSFLYRFFILTSDHTLKSCHFEQIYMLGDSLSDTGNLIRQVPNGSTTQYAHLPYGETFFKNATGRASDGLLLIDYIAIDAGLPLLNPHLNYQANFINGEDFAVAGATALSGEVLANHNISSSATNSSLAVQVDWLFAHLNSTCYPNRDCSEKLSNSLFIVGEIGGNDYNYAFDQGKTLEEVMREELPAVVQLITNAVRTLLNKGAIGQFPLGCFPIQLTLFSSNDSASYDELHCLKSVNNVLMHHNEQLQLALQGLKQEYPHAIIVYGDNYNAFLWLYRNAPYFGFDSTLLQKSCCGIGGEYNYDADMTCGLSGVLVCPDARVHISWDGVHMTEEAHKMLTRQIISDILPKLHCSAKLDPISLGRKSLETMYVSSICRIQLDAAIFVF